MQVDQILSGYKLTEVGIIPSDWDIIKLADISTNIGDGIHATPEYVNCSDFYFINGNNLVDGSIKITENTKSISIGEFTKYKKELSDRTILLSINGTIGNLAFFNNENVILGKSVAYININKLIEKKYIFYFLQSSFIANYFKNELTGSTINNLSLQSIRNTPILVPKSDTEQKRIAQVLSDIDELIRSLDELIIKKRNIKQGTMQLLLTGKQRLPGYSGEWEIKKLGDLGNIVSGGTPKTSINSFWDGNIAWCTPTDITALKGSKYLHYTKRKITELGLINSSAQMLPINSVVMTTRATIGEYAINTIPVSTNQGFKSIVPNMTIDVEFLYYKLLMAKPDLITLGSGSTFFEVSKTDIVNYELFFPISLEEQKAIARILSDMDEEIEVLEAKRDKYQDIKKATMQELLTGKTRI